MLLSIRENNKGGKIRAKNGKENKRVQYFWYLQESVIYSVGLYKMREFLPSLDDFLFSIFRAEIFWTRMGFVWILYLCLLGITDV